MSTDDLRADNEAALKHWKDGEIARALRRLADQQVTYAVEVRLGVPFCAALDEAARRLEGG